MKFSILHLVEKFREASIWHFLSEYSKLELMLFAIGILTIFFIIINFFTSLNERSEPPHTQVPLSYDDMDTFMNMLSYAINSPEEKSSHVTILTNGDEFLEDLLLEIKKSKKSIYITNYIWTDGKFGNILLKALIEKAQNGVEVRLLLDAVGSHRTSEKLIAELQSHGGKVTFFRPLRWWNINRIDRRTHLRDFVIDGKVAYIGGIAIDDKWLGNATTPTSWHDFMFKVTGPSASRLESVFANIWSQSTGELLQVLKSPETILPKDAPRMVTLFSTPAPDTSSNMEHFIWMSIVASSKSIHIVNPYILPSKSIKEALMSKAQSGVEVIIIGPGDTDAKHVKWASQSFYTDLLEAGVQIYEYQPARIHAKTMTMDGVWSIVGSANLDNRSSRINLELIVGVNDGKLAKDLEEKFAEDLKKSKRITKEAWATESKLRWPLSLFSRLFIRQY